MKPTEPDSIPTKTRPGSWDALEKAEPDEPIFVLLARDEHAAPLVKEWVRRVREAALKLGDWNAAEPKLRKATDAEAIAWAMDSWRRNEREAGIPAEPKEHYSGYKEKAEDKARNDRVATLKHLASRLHNAVYEVNESAIELRKIAGVEAELLATATSLEYIHQLLKSAAFAIEPKRPDYRAEPKMPGV